MPRRIESPWEKLLRRAQSQGQLDAREGARRPKQAPQLVDALGITVKLTPGQLADLNSCYRAGFSLGGEWS
jgi:hypothetical protein